MSTELRQLRGQLATQIKEQQTDFDIVAFRTENQVSDEDWESISENVYLAACGSLARDGEIDPSDEKQLSLIAGILKLESGQVDTLTTKGKRLVINRAIEEAQVDGAVTQEELDAIKDIQASLGLDSKRSASTTAAENFRKAVVQVIQSTPPQEINYNQLIDDHGVDKPVADEVAENIMTRYCVTAFSDGVISEEENEGVRRLAGVFGFSTEAVTDIANRSREAALREQVDEAQADGVVDAEEMAALKQLSQSLNLSGSLETSLALSSVARTLIPAESSTGLQKNLATMLEAIPGDDLSFMEDRVVVSQSISVPVFAAEVHSLYESRSTRQVDRPYRGESVPDRKVTKENIQPWSYDFTSSTSFTDQADDYEITDSRQVDTCHTCTGTRKVTCHNCAGSKKDTCPTCHGSTRQSCSGCNGKGQINKPITQSQTIPCPNCRTMNTMAALGAATPMFCGRCANIGMIQTTTQVDNWVPCVRCSASGKVPCSRCAASGQITCPTCNGSGDLTCDPCDGQGKLVFALVVTRHLKASKDEVTFTDPAMDDAALPLLKATDFTMAVDQTHPCFTAEMVATAKPDQFRNQLQQTITNLSSQASDNNRVHHTWLRVRYAKVDILDYQYDKRRYRAWFLGPDKRIHCPDSPATVSMKSKAQLALNYWLEWDLLEALPVYRQCLQMAKRDNACKNELKLFCGDHPSKLYFMAKYGYLMLGMVVAGVAAGIVALVM